MYFGKPKFCARCGERAFRRDKDGVCDACRTEEKPMDFRYTDQPYDEPTSLQVGIAMCLRELDKMWRG